MNIENRFEIDYAKGGPNQLLSALSFGTLNMLNDLVNAALDTTDGWYCRVTDKETGETETHWAETFHQADRDAMKSINKKMNGHRFDLEFKTSRPDMIDHIFTLGTTALINGAFDLLGVQDGWFCDLHDIETNEEVRGHGATKGEAMIDAHKKIKKKIAKIEEEEKLRIEKERKKEEEARIQELIEEQERKNRIRQLSNNSQSSEGSAEGCAIQLGLIVALITVVVIALVYILMFAVALIALTAPVAILIGYFIRSKKYIPFASKFTDNSTDENPMHQSPWLAGVSTFLSAVLVWGVWKNATIQGITRELGGDSLQNYIGYIYLFVGGIAFFFFLKSLLQNILPYRENGKFFWREDSRLLMVGASVLCLLCGMGYEFYTRNEIVPSNETVTNVSVNQNTIENNSEKQLNTNSDDEYIAFIKKRYSEIKASKNLETKNYEFSEFDDNSCGFGATLTYFLENGNIVEIDFETRMGKNLTKSEDYFENGKLFFSFSTYTTSSTASHGYGEEHRYYIKDENCILYKYKEKLIVDDRTKTDINEIRVCSDSAKNEVIKGANNLYNGYGSSDMRKVVCE